MRAQSAQAFEKNKHDQKPCLWKFVVLHLLLLISMAKIVHAELEFTVAYSGQTTRTWNFSDGTRHRITLNANGTVKVRPNQIKSSDGQSFISDTAVLETTNHVWGRAVEDGSAPTYTFDFDATRTVSRSPSSTSSHFTPQTANYLYFETNDSISAPPNDITVYAWEYVSSLQVMRLWVALEYPFYYDSQYEHYDFPATHIVTGQSSAHSWLIGEVLDSQGTAVPGAQVVFGGVSKVSDAQGNFQFGDIPSATYDLEIMKAGYAGYTGSETIPAFSILHKTYTLPRPIFSITSMWSGQVAGSRFNSFPGSAGAYGNQLQMIVMGAANNDTAEMFCELSVSPPDVQSLNRVKLRLADMNGNVIVTGQLTGNVARFVAPVAANSLQCHVEGWVDLDGNDELNPASGEIKEVSPGTFMIIRQAEYDASKTQLRQKINPIVGRLVFPIALSLVDGFLNHSIPAGSEYRRDFAITGGGVLDHNVGADFGAGMSPIIPEYVFSPVSGAAKRVCASKIIREAVIRALDREREFIATQFATTNVPEVTIPLFDGSPATGISFPEPTDSNVEEWNPAELLEAWDLYFAFHDATLHDGLVVISKADSTSVRITGTISDIYDFKWEAGDLSGLACRLQAGYPTLGTAGRPFRTLVELDRHLPNIRFDGFPSMGIVRTDLQDGPVFSLSGSQRPGSVSIIETSSDMINWLGYPIGSINQMSFEVDLSNDIAQKPKGFFRLRASPP
jgi:hypothetical protein